MEIEELFQDKERKPFTLINKNHKIALFALLKLRFPYKHFVPLQPKNSRPLSGGHSPFFHEAFRESGARI